MSYIDTKYLFECETSRCRGNRGCDTYCDHGELYSPNLEKIPMEDVAPVVRCRDCDFSVGDDEKSPLNCIHANGLYMPAPNDFCSFGKPKGDESDA